MYRRWLCRHCSFSFSSSWLSGVAKAKQLKFLVSGSNQFSRVNVSHAAAAEALKNAKELLARGYVDVKICTPRGQILVPDDFEQLER